MTTTLNSPPATHAAGPSRYLRALILPIVAFAITTTSLQAQDQQLREGVLRAIEQAQKYLINEQNPNGSWNSDGGARYKVGLSSLVMLSLLNSGIDADEAVIQRGLSYLRSIREPEPRLNYDMSVMIMALAAAKEKRDLTRIARLAAKLENNQIRKGSINSSGLWDYAQPNGRGDRSNGQFALLALRDAANLGIPIDRRTWELARTNWMLGQKSDGGWAYVNSDRSSGSMTVAGLASLAITETMLRDEDDVNPDGSPVCCDHEQDDAIARGIAWLANNFDVGRNPRSGNWHLYYLYGLERAGRLNGLRFFGEHDWYRAGARFLVKTQSVAKGMWLDRQTSSAESDPVVATSLALLFLSKGLAPVLVNKLQYGPPDPRGRGQTLSDDWNNHPLDTRNLTELISKRPQWPKLLISQVVNVNNLGPKTGVQDLRQSPVLFISGQDRPNLTAQQITLLREYVNEGGFIFAVANCSGAGFDRGFRDLIRKMFPNGEADLLALREDHPVYRSEYLLDPKTVELYGVDFGCRTAIMYSPEDLSCLWDKWRSADIAPPPKKREAFLKLKPRVIRATRIGVNVIAYATGREPAGKLDLEEIEQKDDESVLDRGLLQIARLRHTGGWDTAPRAIQNLAKALNETGGVRVSTKMESLLASDKTIHRYPIVYMHGRHAFTLNATEKKKLREYLDRGSVLLADSCCGAARFDKSFRRLMAEIYPDHPLKRVPADHEIFGSDVGHDIKTTRRRVLNRGAGNLQTRIEQGEPFLEGVEVDGRLAVIYSKYDISCALERQSTVACEGYTEDDAFRLAVNMVLYAMLQDL